MRERLLREESGFTLAEVMVTIMLMLTVMFALYNIFDMGLRVFSFGNSKVEAVENARLGLGKMEREIRAAYPYSKAASNSTLFTTWTPNQITFGNDLSSGDRVIDTSVGSSEVITYKLNDGCPTPPSDAVCNLQRVSGGTSSPVVEYVQPGGLTFKYLKEDGLAVAGNESEIKVVRISLEVKVKRGPQAGTQVLTTDVALRNRIR